MFSKRSAFNCPTDQAFPLTSIRSLLGEAVADQGSGVLLALDEVQYLTAEELGALITAIHRTTQLSLPVILVGAGLPQLPGLAGQGITRVSV